jgi:hypothetical protein
MVIMDIGTKKTDGPHVSLAKVVLYRFCSGGRCDRSGGGIGFSFRESEAKRRDEIGRNVFCFCGKERPRRFGSVPTHDTCFVVRVSGRPAGQRRL